MDNSETANQQSQNEVFPKKEKYRSRIKERHGLEWTEGSGVAKVIVDLNLRSISSIEARKLINWGKYTGDGEDPLTDGWWCNSVNPVTGEDTDFGQFKPDKVFKSKGKKTAKYLSPKEVDTEAIYLRMPDPDYWQKVLEDVSIPVYITEGAKKAGALLSLGYPAIALVGVWNGQKAKGRELIDTLKLVAQPGRVVVFVFDSDLITKIQVRSALQQLGQLTLSRGCLTRVSLWEPREGKGIDDVLVNAGRQRVDEIVASGVNYDWWLKKAQEDGYTNPETLHGKVWQLVALSFAPRLEIDQFSLEYRLDGQKLVFPCFQADVGEEVGADVPKTFLLDVIHYWASKNR